MSNENNLGSHRAVDVPVAAQGESHGQPLSRVGPTQATRLFITSSDAKPWPKGIVTGGRIATARLGEKWIVTTEPVELFGSITIPSGYASDGGSIPRFAALTATRFGKLLPAFLVHDARYDPPHDKRVMTRKEADKELYENCRTCGAWWWNAQKIYWAVRAFGGAPWKNNKRFQEAA